MESLLFISVGASRLVAGSGACDWSDGFGSNAVFCNPTSLAVDSSGVLYVADSGNAMIRIVDVALGRPLKFSFLWFLIITVLQDSS
jgi:hypothetical protein